MESASLNIIPVTGGVCVVPADRPQNPAYALIIVATTAEAEREIERRRVA